MHYGCSVCLQALGFFSLSRRLDVYIVAVPSTGNGEAGTGKSNIEDCIRRSLMRLNRRKPGFSEKAGQPLI
jgi:hypothetical protein